MPAELMLALAAPILIIGFVLMIIGLEDDKDWLFFTGLLFFVAGLTF